MPQDNEHETRPVWLQVRDMEQVNERLKLQVAGLTRTLKKQAATIKALRGAK